MTNIEIAEQLSDIINFENLSEQQIECLCEAKKVIMCKDSKVGEYKCSVPIAFSPMSGMRDISVVRCKDCKYFSMTTLGMPYACWHGANKIYGETGEHAYSAVCIRVDSLEHYCSYGERKEDGDS